MLINDGGAPVGFELASLTDALVRDGVDVRVPLDQALMFGWRAKSAPQSGLTLQLVVVDPTVAPPERPGASLFAAAGRLALYRIA